MEKQTVGSSTDRWQRPPSRGSGLLPQPSHNQSGPAISPSGIVSGGGGGSKAATTSSHLHAQGQSHHPSTSSSLHHQQHQPTTSTAPPQLLPRKKSVLVCGGAGGGRDEHQHHVMMSPPPGGMNSEQRSQRGGGGQQGGGVPPQSQGTSGDITTATAIVHQHDPDTLESCSRSPLLCLICNKVYEDPRLLSCYHSFCAKCLPGRLGDAKLVCPLCGKPTPLKDGTGPPSDHLLRFLLHSSPDIHPSCANCDNKSRAPMYYCNTCGQVLCNGCREETHRAKMFSTHDIIPVSKYTKDTPKKCSVHGEQFIMFSNLQKTMLCINCYRDTAMEGRLHCVDLETAYSQGCKKLDRAVMSLRDLQVAVRDGITMLKNVLEELRRNSDSEKSAVNAVCQVILDALTKTQENLLKDVDCQMEGKDKVIRGQLCQLRSVLPTIKLHLTMCATISNATNKYDFLDLAYPLIDRLMAITHMGSGHHAIRPGLSSQIKSTYKVEMARTLEPWVQPWVSGGAHGGGGATTSKSSSHHHLQKDYTQPADPSLSEPMYSQYFPMSRSTVTPMVQKSQVSQLGGGYAAPAGAGGGTGPQSGRKTPVFKSDRPDEHFAAHCRSFTAHVNELNQRLSRLKEQVQELHRDVTLQRGSSHTVRAASALREGLFLEDQLERRHSEMERIRKHLESHWNDNIRQIRLEQEVFQSQINDLLAMKSEVKQLSSLLQQLQSFLKSLNVHPPPQQQQPGRGGGGGGGGGAGHGGASSSGGGGGGGSSAGVSGTSGIGKMATTTSSSSGQQGVIQHGQPNRQTQQHVHHSGVPDASSSRTDIGSQVTPSLGEMAYLEQSKDGGVGGQSLGPSQKSDPNRPFGAQQPQRPTSSSMPTPSGGLSTAKQQSFQPAGFVPRPCYQQKQPTQAEMEYIQVDTSYSHPPHQQQQQQSHSSKIGGPPPHPNLGASEASMMKSKGVLSQLIDKVRLKDDRKKSSASGVSSSSSGGTPHPQPPAVPPSASALAARRALTMYDAQCQFGLDSSSAVSALAKSNLKRGVQSGEPAASSTSFSHQRHESRPTYQRAKSFVKSKSDDERGQLIDKSLSSGSKDATRIIELYQSLSKTIMERENQQFQSRTPYPSQIYNPYSLDQPIYFDSRYEKYGTSSFMGTIPPKSSSSAGSFPYGQSNSLGRTHSSNSRQGPTTPFRSSSHPRPQESLTATSEDDYQQISFNFRSLPMARSHSAPPRKPTQEHRSSGGGGGGQFGGGAGSSTEVKVFVHEEPHSSTSSHHHHQQHHHSRHTASRSPSPSAAALSKSLEESFLYGYLSQHHGSGGGGLTSSSSGQSGVGGGGGFTPSPLGKKPSSAESLVSLGAMDTDGQSRKSSIDFDRRSVVTVRRAGSNQGSKSALLTRQHSWEGGAQLSGTREHSMSTPHLSPTADDPFENRSGAAQSASRGGGVRASASSSHSRRRSRIYDDDEDDLVVGNTLHKADSFEGHEEAVRSIVAAVQETRTLQRRLQSN
ncbi:hypothetical protein Fcan01_07864 [Folsomia candida]|uniref:RING finger protein 207 n=1 Tax=Folsomia candida TaxID=158441 RepID=A0A226EN88_FOLCA|nr:hypothetical protein Fcan01_07864 [Folsomia candida]